MVVIRELVGIGEVRGVGMLVALFQLSRLVRFHSVNEAQVPILVLRLASAAIMAPGEKLMQNRALRSC